MKLPPKFIIAFPNGYGNTWEHYHFVAVDLNSKTCFLNRTRFESGYLLNDFKIAFESTKPWTSNGLAQEAKWMTKQYGLTKQAENMWLIRLCQLKSNTSTGFITNGMTKNNEEFVIYNEDSRTKVLFPQKTPIRFIPVKMDAFTGIVDNNQNSFEELRKQIYDLFDKKWSIESGHVFTQKVKVFTGSESDWNQFLIDCESIFNQLSLSQISFGIIYSKERGRLKKWSSYLRHALFDQNIEDKGSFLLKKLGFCKKEVITQKIIKESVQRFARRHPTRATTTLLKMIAFCTGFGGAKNYHVLKST